METYYLTEQIVYEIISPLHLPGYSCEEEVPGQLILEFAEAEVFISENPYYGSIKTEIHHPATGKTYALYDILPFFIKGYRTDKTGLSHLGLTETFHWPPSEKKVRAELTNDLLIISRYLIPVLRGNFDWVQAHDAFKANMKRIADALGPQWPEVISDHPVYLKLASGDPSWETDLGKL